MNCIFALNFILIFYFGHFVLLFRTIEESIENKNNVFKEEFFKTIVLPEFFLKEFQIVEKIGQVCTVIFQWICY